MIWMRAKLQKIFELRVKIKKILAIVKQDFPFYMTWASDIEIIIEAVFVDFLDAPTDANFDAILRYWNSTEPVLTAIMQNGTR